MTKKIELPLPPGMVPPLTKIEKPRKVPTPLPLPVSAYPLPPTLTVVKAPSWLQSDPEEEVDDYSEDDEDNSDTYCDQTSPPYPRPFISFDPEECKPIKTTLKPIEELGWVHPTPTQLNVPEVPQNASVMPSLASLFAPDESASPQVCVQMPEGNSATTTSGRKYLTFFQFVGEQKPALIDITNAHDIPRGIHPREWFEKKIRERYESISQGPIAKGKAERSLFVREVVVRDTNHDQDSFLVGIEIMQTIPKVGQVRSKLAEYWVQCFREEPIRIG